MLEIKNLNKIYINRDFKNIALNNLSMKFSNNEFVAILGPSGCGKTTLLNIIGGLDKADSGDVFLSDKKISDFTEKQLDMYRNNSIGFIFQSHNLIPHLTVLENVVIATKLSNTKKDTQVKKAKEVLEKVGLTKHLNKKPNQLSGGQSQRVAIARALINDPDIILADEPTGSVDSETSENIMQLIQEISKDKLVILVTHDQELAEKYATRIVKIKDGSITSDSKNSLDDNSSNSELLLKKTHLTIYNSFILAVKNLKSKIGRAVLTMFASSIGLIGITLVISISNGMNNQVDLFQKKALSSMPITISKTSIDINKMLNNTNNNLEEYPTEPYLLINSGAISDVLINNPLSDKYVKYIEDYKKIDAGKTILTTNYEYTGNITYKAKINNKYIDLYKEVKDGTSMPLSPIGAIFDEKLFKKEHDLIYGSYGKVDLDKKEVDVVVAVDKYNRVFYQNLNKLGINISDNKISPELIIGQKIYMQAGTFDPKKAYTLKVSGIVRPKKNVEFPTVSLIGVGYPKELLEKMRQDNPEEFGDVKKISIYPKDFNSKKEIKKHLDNYNTTVLEEEKIKYIDQSEIMANISKQMIDAISTTLIAFTSISLIVSSIMIATLTYTSVIERKKEIGILRALGARKKDISRIFNSENIMLGLLSGFLSVLISFIIIIIINVVIQKEVGISNVSYLQWYQPFIIIFISCLITYIAGVIPAYIASKKDPVKSLKSE